MCVLKQDESPVAFNDYFKQKSRERVNKFKCKKKGTIENGEKSMKTINVAFMKIINGDMKQDRNTTLLPDHEICQTPTYGNHEFVLEVPQFV